MRGGSNHVDVLFYAISDVIPLLYSVLECCGGAVFAAVNYSENIWFHNKYRSFFFQQRPSTADVFNNLFSSFVLKHATLHI